MFTRTPKRGSTLVELPVAIAILGVLVALVLPALSLARDASLRTSRANRSSHDGIAPPMPVADTSASSPGTSLSPPLGLFLTNYVARSATRPNCAAVRQVEGHDFVATAPGVDLTNPRELGPNNEQCEMIPHVLADGTVRVVSHEVDPMVSVQLITRTGEESAPIAE